MSNLAILSAASKSTTSTAAPEPEDSTSHDSQETVSAPPSPPEDAQAPAKPEQLSSGDMSEGTEDTPMAGTDERSQNTTMSDSDESGSDHSSDDQIPHDGGSDLWQAIRLKRDEIERYEAMIEEELEGGKSGKERRLIGLRAKLAQQIEARDVFLGKQAEVDKQARNARWG